LIPRLFVYMGQNFINNTFIFYTGNNSHVALTMLADCNINIKYPF